jgi:PAS domain S-box-containing protein
MSAQPAVAQGDLHERLRLEELLAKLSSKFVNLPPAEVDHEIEDELRCVCELLAIDLAVLWQWSSDDPGVIRPTHFFPSEEGLKASEPLDQDQCPWVVQQMVNGSVIALSSLDELPAAAVFDRESALLSGIKSTLCLPVAVGGGSPVGALAFNTTRAEHDWPDILVQRLQLVANVFTNALVRKRHELSLQESEERLALAADSAGAGLWNLDLATGVFWATARAREIFGYSHDESITMAQFEASVHPEDRNRVRETIERSVGTGEPLQLDYRIVASDARVRWISSRGRPRYTSAGEPELLMGVSCNVSLFETVGTSETRHICKRFSPQM